jgi:hypothetical protein
MASMSALDVVFVILVGLWAVGAFFVHTGRTRRFGWRDDGKAIHVLLFVAVIVGLVLLVQR